MRVKHVIKTVKSGKGNDITFRYLRREDLDAMLTYINELIAEDTFIGMYGTPLTIAEETEYLESELTGMQRNDISHIVVEAGDRFIGEAEVRRERLRRKKHVGLIAISLLSSYRNERIGTQLMKTLFEEARRMNLTLLELTCFENNPLALHMYEKLGFKRIGVIPEAIAYKGGFVGEVTLYLSLANSPKSI